MSALRTTSTGSECAPRAIELGFPIAEINRLAVPERNSFKPIYQIHKWFARRASCVFRAILLGVLKPAYQPDGTETDIMREFYKSHSDDPDTAGKRVVDPFMGGGTTVVEAMRLGCDVVGIDLNPVAWFVVKMETTPVDLDALKAAFNRLSRTSVAWNDGRPLRETLLDLYKTEIAPGVVAEVIYTFWVKHAVCTASNCRREVPLFKDYIVAQKTVSVKYYRDAGCPICKGVFDLEVDVASLVADPRLMANASQGSAGEGRPYQRWAHAEEPKKSTGKSRAFTLEFICPCCQKGVTLATSLGEKKERKKVPLTVLFCPSCEELWQWRGKLPDDSVTCPCCRHAYDPWHGNVPEKGKFRCPCGNQDAIVESIRLLPKDQRLPVRPYAIQAFHPGDSRREEIRDQGSLFEEADHDDRSPAASTASVGLIIPANRKFFKRFTTSDWTRLRQAEVLWEEHGASLPHPTSTIPIGEKTKSGLLAHHYNHWHEMFSPRQLLALSTLLQGIMAEPDPLLQEFLLCAFSDCAGRNNTFCRYFDDRNTIQEIFSRHDYQPKGTYAEGSVFGGVDIRGTYPQMFSRLVEGKEFNARPFDWSVSEDGKRSRVLSKEIVSSDRLHLNVEDSRNFSFSGITSHAVTDPPYVGNVNYAELSDFFYVWLRLVLKIRYPWFAPDHTPKREEVGENRTQRKDRKAFYDGLSDVLRQIHSGLGGDGLLVFTFHHTDQEGTVWEGLLQSLCDTGFELAAVYPIHGESESSLHLMDKANVSYDLIHICRKRREDPTERSWASIRQEVRRRAREELAEIEKGRYGKQPLPEPDVRLICIGKCLELYSAHYGRVVDADRKPIPLRTALADIDTIYHQLVTRDQPLPAQLEDTDLLTRAWFRSLMVVKREIDVDKLNKELRGTQVSADDLKRAGLIVRGRTGRGRTYEVKQPQDRLEGLMRTFRERPERASQVVLFDGNNHEAAVPLVDMVHVLLGLADAGEPLQPWLEQFGPRHAELLAALRYARKSRSDWDVPVRRILGILEGSPLFDAGGDD